MPSVSCWVAARISGVSPRRLVALTSAPRSSRSLKAIDLLAAAEPARRPQQSRVSIGVPRIHLGGFGKTLWKRGVAFSGNPHQCGLAARVAVVHVGPAATSRPMSGCRSSCQLCLEAAARSSGVLPSASTAFTSAPCTSSTFTVAAR